MSVGAWVQSRCVHAVCATVYAFVRVCLFVLAGGYGCEFDCVWSHGHCEDRTVTTGHCTDVAGLAPALCVCACVYVQGRFCVFLLVCMCVC